MAVKDFIGRDIVSMRDFTKKDIIDVLETAKRMEKLSNMKLNRNMMNGKIMASLFFEPSIRTRLSFESGMNKLGGRVIGFADAGFSMETDENRPQVFKGGGEESLKDIIKSVEKFADVIVIKHIVEGSAKFAAEVSNVSVINAGDGNNQNPTQTLLDLYTIKKTQNQITDLKIGLSGDLKYNRTVHSLAVALAMFKAKIYLISPDGLKMPKSVFDEIHKTNADAEIAEISETGSIINELDVLYSAGIQKERFSDATEYGKVKDSFKIEKRMLRSVKSNFKLMHPLPRTNEISEDVDESKYAAYFEQSANGIPIRQSLLAMVTGRFG